MGHLIREGRRIVDGFGRGMSIKDFRPPKEVLVDSGAGQSGFPQSDATSPQGGFNNKGPLA
jgi:hypothetical protein